MTARNLPDKSTETQAKEQELTRRWPSVWESNSEDFHRGVKISGVNGCDAPCEFVSCSDIGRKLSCKGMC